MQNNSLIQPFGEISFETEFERLGASWEEYFFEQTYFVEESLRPETYLIVGRRGSGKSSLIQHIIYQDKYPNSDYIDFGFADSYNAELYKIAESLLFSQELKVQKLVKVWDYIIWQIIFKKLSANDKLIKKGVFDDCTDPSVLNFLKLIVKGLLNRAEVSHGDDLIEMLSKRASEERFRCAQEVVLTLLSKNPLFIVIDSREKYSLDNENEMCITAALIQAASLICDKYAIKGLHLKVCIADEIFPYLKEQYVTNTLKYIKYPLYMYWRPKDLMRLVCWRLFKYLSINKAISLASADVDWDSHKDILEKIWIPYFGKKIRNKRGVTEETFPYILRHTHLRPRQVILVCNEIARLAIRRGEFPKFSQETIREAVQKSEIDLSDEIINSYSTVYPKAGNIISALEGMPMKFKCNELYRASKRTASYWDHGNYSQLEFIKLVIELGIVGRVRESYSNSKVIKADFEFALQDRLFVTEKDTCVIHPLFYSKLNINRNDPSDECVYPFPDRPEFEVMNG